MCVCVWGGGGDGGEVDRKRNTVDSRYLDFGYLE